MGGLADRLLERGTTPGVRPPADPETEKACPLLWGLLTQDRYRDGTVRVLPTIRIERVHGGYLVTLQDHASNQQVSCEVTKLWELHFALEQILASGENVFRPYSSMRVKDPTKRAKGK